MVAVLVLLITGACLAVTEFGTGVGAQTTTSSNATNFVRVDGRQFRVGDQPFFFQGSNLHYLGPAGQNFMTESQVDDMLRWYRDTGLKVVRFWAFGDAWVDYEATNVTGNIVLNARSLRRLDFVVARAAAYNLKIITAFVNYEPDYSGITDWVQRILGTLIVKETFYVSNEVWQAYKSFVSSIILRRNQITGIVYRDDPTIMAWEVMNEPHTSNGFEWQFHNQTFVTSTCLTGGNAVTLDANDEGRLVYRWICRAAAFIKSIDGNHMVASGEEGYRAHGPIDPEHAWINDGLKGVDFELDAQCAYLDFMTMHVYPDNWAIPYAYFKPVIEQHMADRAAIAFANGKPIIVEEYGCCKDPDYKGHRGVVFDHMNNMVQKYGYAGLLVWQFNAWGQDMDPNYDFGCYNQDGVAEYLSNANLMNYKTRYFWDILRDGARNGTVNNGYIASNINCWVADAANRLVKCYDTYGPWPPAATASIASVRLSPDSNVTIGQVIKNFHNATAAAAPDDMGGVSSSGNSTDPVRRGSDYHNMCRGTESLANETGHNSSSYPKHHHAVGSQGASAAAGHQHRRR